MGNCQPASCKGGRSSEWCAVFLATLAETSNVSLAADEAGIHKAHAYRLRREDVAFAARWYDALLEGYEHLEMEVLERLRTGIDPAKDAAKFDNANALRLLALHKQTIDKLRANRSRRSERDVLAEINARIDRIRAAEKAARATETSRNDGN